MDVNALLATWVSLETLAIIVFVMLCMQGLQGLFRLVSRKYRTYMHTHDGIVSVHLYIVSKIGGDFSEYEFKKDAKGRYRYYECKEERRIKWLFILALTVVYVLVVAGVIIKDYLNDLENVWKVVCLFGWIYFLLFIGLYALSLMNRFTAWCYLYRHRQEISE